MGFIFNRLNDEYDVYEPELAALKASSDIEIKAMAINIIHDHRVSEEREVYFREEYFKKSGNNLLVALNKHANTEVKFHSNPEFCRPYCDNLIADCSDPTSVICEEVSQNTELATVISINALSKAFINTHLDVINGIPELEDFKDVDTDSEYFINVRTMDGELEIKRTGFDDWLDTRLNKPPDEVLSFLEAVFKLLKYRLDNGNYYHPIWVTKWTDFEPYTKDLRTDGSKDIDRWNQVLGVKTNLYSWQIVLKYPANAVECLYRPTVLDGGYNYPQHFPSPPDETTQMGGITMDLGTPDNILLPEFIHKQIELKIDYWINAGRLIGQTKIGDYTTKLVRNRTSHHEKLKNKFSAPKIENWMHTPI